MRLEVGLFFKKRPTERCEMFGTMPRRMASSAISRWLHWLMGRSLSDGSRRSSPPPRRPAPPYTSAGLPIAAHRPTARRPSACRPPAAIACANTVPFSARHQAPVHFRARLHPPLRAQSCGRAAPIAVASNGFVSAVPAARAAQAKQLLDRRPVGASQPPVPASDSSCHNTADSTP